ncbi:hypothetical protein WDW86_04575 [Bdellovibrionota bacterium FG-2]
MPTPLFPRGFSQNGPETSEKELNKAYNCVIESGVTYHWERNPIAGVNPDEVPFFYRRAFAAQEKGDRLSAERWARVAKHLAYALWHEAKIAYLEPRIHDLPYLSPSATEDAKLQEEENTAADLILAYSTQTPAGESSRPETMQRYILRAKQHLHAPMVNHDLLKVERIRAAHEYGRTLECMMLAYESEANLQKAA